ncbi:MAG: hypothetical protein AAFO07_26765 [Bacteroidota bacterium]
MMRSILVFYFFTCWIGWVCAQKTPTLWTANWSHDGQYIAVGGGDFVLKIIDGISFEVIDTFQLHHNIERVRWHPKRNLLAITISGPTAKPMILDPESRKKIFLDDLPDLGGRAIAWNHTGEYIAVADYEEKISVWDINGKLIQFMSGHTTKSHVAVDWHPKKNEFIALSDPVTKHNIKGELLDSARHRKDPVLMLCVQWHPSGKFFVIGDYGTPSDTKLPALLQFWSPDLEKIKEIEISKAAYRNVSWNKKGNRLATASDVLRIWSKKGKLLAEGPRNDNLWGVDWSPNGKYIITSSEEGHIRLWNNKAELIKEIEY